MIYQLENGNWVDSLPIAFIILASIGLFIGITALFIGKGVKNTYRKVVIFLFVLVVLMFAGAISTGIIGYNNPYVFFDGVNYDNGHDVCAYICIGLGVGTLLFSVLTIVVQALTKDIKPKGKPKNNTEPSVEGVNLGKDSSKCYFYERFSHGAIEVREDYLVIYRNWLPFSFFTFGRFATTIFINDIQHIEYKGCGWFPGTMMFTFKHFNKPARVLISKWFFWRRMKFNNKITPVYDYIRTRVIQNNK